MLLWTHTHSSVNFTSFTLVSHQKFDDWPLWCDRWHSFLWMWVSASQESFVCFGAKPTQRACARDFLRDRKKTREGKVPWQSTEENSQEKSGEGDGQRNAAAKRGVRYKMSQRSWWLHRSFARIHARESQMHRKPHESVTNLSLLERGANPSPWLFFFSSILSVVYVVSCVFVNDVKCPWPEMRETIRWSDGHELV